MAVDCEFILLNGPAFAGKSHFCQKFSKYHRISHTELFEKNAELGLRDVGLTITQLLKKGNYVIVDDTNALRSTRSSYINIVKRKIPDCKIGVLKIYPRHGLRQCLWAKEHWYSKHYQYSDCLETAAPRQEIAKWFSDENATRVSFLPRKIDNPEKDASVDFLDEYTLPLTVHSSFKLEVPALLIDFKGIVEGEEEQCTLHPGIHEVLKLWYKSNPEGRIIILSNHPGELKRSEETILMRCMKMLVQKLADCPVYLLVIDQSRSGRFSSPPDPEFLGFVQRRHTLDLQYKNSVFLYAPNNNLKKMAESAGLQHIKASKALEQPSLVAGDVIGVKPVVPEFLRDFEYFCCENSPPENPQIPQYSNVNNFKDNFIIETLNAGRKEFLFSNDKDIIERYQLLYSNYATSVDEEGSSLQQMIANGMADDSAQLQSLSPSSAIQKLNRSFSSSRELPKWMLHQKDSKSSIESDSGKSVNKTSSLRARQLIYVMTPQELVEMASEILKQAGKSDIVQEVIQKSLNPDSVNISNTNQTGEEEAIGNVKTIKEVKDGTESENIVNPTCTLLNDIFTCDEDSRKKCSPRKKRRGNKHIHSKPETSKMNLMEMDINSKCKNHEDSKTRHENEKKESQVSVTHKPDLSFLDDIF